MFTDQQIVDILQAAAAQSENPNCKVGAALFSVHGLDMKLELTSYNHGDTHAEDVLCALYLFAHLKTFFYCTKAPCLSCAQHIVNAGIDTLIIPPPYEINPRTLRPSKWFKEQVEALNYLMDNAVNVRFMYPIETMPGA